MFPKVMGNIFFLIFMNVFPSCRDIELKVFDTVDEKMTEIEVLVCHIQIKKLFNI